MKQMHLTGARNLFHKMVLVNQITLCSAYSSHLDTYGFYMCVHLPLANYNQTILMGGERKCVEEYAISAQCLRDGTENKK